MTSSSTESEDPAAVKRETWTRWLVVIATFAIAFLLYLPSVDFEFTLDDPLVTTLNPHVRADDGDWSRYLTTNLYAGTPQEKQSGNLYRPLLTLSLAMNYRMDRHRFQPAWFHLTNILLYALCSVAVLLVLQSLLKGPSRYLAFAPWLISILFVVFPSHLESVCNIKHREEVLALLFGMLSWLVILRTHGRMSWGRVLLAMILFFAAIASKESAILLLPCMVLWEWKRGEPRPNRWTWLLGCLLAIAAYMVLRYLALGALLSPAGTRTFHDASLAGLSRVSLASTTFLEFYVWDQLVALKLNPAFSSPFIVSRSGPIATVDVASLLCLIAVFSATFVWFWRTASLAAFAALFFFINSALTLQVVPIGTAGAFRLMFTSSFGLCLLLGSLSLTHRRSWMAVLFVAMVAVYGVVTMTRMSIWNNNATLMEYAASVDRRDPLGSYAAAQGYNDQRDQDRRSFFYAQAYDRFNAFEDEPERFDENWFFAYAFSTTEVANSMVSSEPLEALHLADKAIALFRTVEELRGGVVHEAIMGPYYVKAVSLRALGRKAESMKVCREGLAITEHRGLQLLLQELKGR